jgi:hypothetical protein
MACKDWTVRWETTKSGFQRYEVFTAPDGREWVKTKTPAAAGVFLLYHTRGLPPKGLKARKTRERVRKEAA